MTRGEVVTIESLDAEGRPVLIDRATTYEVTQDLTAPFEARFELGDNGTWGALQDAIAIGRRFRVAINGRPLVTGRSLNRGYPQSPRGGATMQVTIRSWLADAQFTSCDPIGDLKGITLKDAVLRAYATLGATESDFVFDADVARDVLTGRTSSTSAKVQLEKLTAEDARVRPPETVYDFVDRHLRRHGFMHWDAPDGRLVVGRPNDEQAPLYNLKSTRTSPRGNNILDARRSEDYEQIPSELNVYGQGGGKDFRRAKVSGTATDATLTAIRPVLRRRVIVVDESVASESLAVARARREMAQRSLMRDSWDLTMPGWTHWEGGRSSTIPYSVNTVANVMVQMGATVGSNPYFVWRVSQTGGARIGHQTVLTVAAQGVWRIA